MAILLRAAYGAVEHHVVRRLSIPLPAFQSRSEINPTLLVSWFCTILSMVTIAIRLMGRWVRNEMLFTDDKIMFWSMIPLLARMGFVHVVLTWGTNNTVTFGLTDVQIQERIMGSRLVLPARILFATYIWITKVTLLEFLKKLVVQSWNKSYVLGMRLVYAFLALTYVAVIVATLAECHPFDNYWQVVPDPGMACRATPIQLITMGVCEVATDLVLVIFPIPLVLMSKMTLKKKLSLISLFQLSIVLIAITCYRIPTTIHRDASQPYRSLMASLEILASTAVTNAIVIGSFLRDRGVKKAKYQAPSTDAGSVLSRVATGQQSRSRSITQHHWGSDEDLVRDFGLSLRSDLRKGSTVADTSTNIPPVPQPLPTLTENVKVDHTFPTVDTNWAFSKPSRSERRRKSSDISTVSTTSTDIKLHDLKSQMEEPVSPGTERAQQISFFEAGTNLDSPYVTTRPNLDLTTTKSHTFLSDIGGLLPNQPKQEEEPTRLKPDAETVAVPDSQPRGSKSSLHPRDPRRLLRSGSPFKRGKSKERIERSRSRNESRSPLRNAGPDDLDIGDAGGLLK